MTCSPHRSLNTSKGVVRCKELLLSNKEEIIEELKGQGVTDVVNIAVKADEANTRQKTNTFIFTSAIPNPPKYLQAYYMRIPVVRYIPKPLRCFKCQKFGHGRNNCRRSPVCVRCSQAGHDHSDCSADIKCANCSDSHMASSKECPTWL